MRRLGGSRRKTRQKLKKKAGARGKLRLKEFLQQFRAGDRVQLIADPSIQKGMFPLRFYGRMGSVKAKRGRSFIIAVREGGKEKLFAVHPAHLKGLGLSRLEKRPL